MKFTKRDWLVVGLVIVVLSVSINIISNIQEKKILENGRVLSNSRTSEQPIFAIGNNSNVEEDEVEEIIVEISSRSYYESYIKSHSNISDSELKELLDSIDSVYNMYNKNIPKSLILSIIQTETDFRNIYSTFESEDSAGFVQMQSSTINYLYNTVHGLPRINSQDEFINNIDAQIKYIFAYINVSNEKYGSLPDCVISSYNTGLYANFINETYVNETLQHKSKLEKHMSVALNR